MLFGEAPGPLGADKSGIPFWGDRAGKPVYRALEAAGLAEVPEEAYGDWQGEQSEDPRDLRPRLREVALSNAFPSCPTRDGETFTAPSDKELRIRATSPGSSRSCARGWDRVPRDGCSVIALGRRAAWILRRLAPELGFELSELPHPSAQGLLQAAPDKGKGLRLADLAAAWEQKLLELLAP